MKTITAHDFPGRTITLSYPLTEKIRSLKEVTSIGLTAVELITGEYLEFYCVDIELSSYDPVLWYPTEDITEEEATWLLKKKEIPQDVLCEPSFRKQSVQVLDHLETKQVKDFINDITQNTNLANDNITFWNSIEFRSVKVMLKQWTEESFFLKRGTHSLKYPVEKNNQDFFVHGPLENYTLVSPIKIVLQNRESNQLDLDIKLLWSYWTDDDSEGAIAIKQALKLLQAQGWQLSLSEVSYAAI